MLNGYVAVPRSAEGAKIPAVMVVHENRGLNRHIEDVARRIALALLVACVVLLALWWALRRYAVPRETSRLRPLAFLLLHLALGFGVLVAYRRKRRQTRRGCRE